jgi:hypothetical protein
LRLRAIASAPLLGALLLALALSIVWAASSPIDDPYSTLNTGWDGASGLAKRGFLAVNENLEMMSSLTNGSEVLLVLGPSRQFSRIEADSIESFVRQGGLLVVADNFGSSNSLLDLLRLPVRLDGRLLIDPLFYRKQPAFPVVSDFSPSELSTGLGALVLDYATVLNITTSDGVNVLARSSPFSFLDSNKDGKKNPEEPSGPFPILAELSLGQGAIVLFASPASFANGLINEESNSVLVENIVGGHSQPGHQPGLLLDQTHLQPSFFTPAKRAAQQLVTSILEGGMQLSQKLGLAGLAIVLVAARHMYKRPPEEALERTERWRTARSTDVEQVSRLHPTWDHKRLEYVASELEACMKWRQLNEGE